MLKRLSAQFASNSNTDLPATLNAYSASYSPSHSSQDNHRSYPQDQPLLSPLPIPQRFPAGYHSPSPSSPHTSHSVPDASQHALAEPLDRTDLHKSLRAMENVLSALDQYRELTDLLYRSQRKLSKATKSLSACIRESAASKTAAERDPVVNGLATAASLLESASESDAKYAKLVQKSYDASNDGCAKVFRKIAVRRPERFHIHSNADYHTLSAERRKPS